MILALAGPSKSGKTVVVEKVVGRDTLIAVQGTRIEGADDVWDRCWTGWKLRRNGSPDRF
jgi:hypothetical protein